MADFKKALEEGFEAAKRAEIARKEVQETLEKLKNDLLAASGNKLLVEVLEFEFREPISLVERYKLAVDMAAIYAKSLQPKKTYKALAARNPNAQNSTTKELATWRQAKDGYPCSLTWGKQERQCEDRVALENALAELLKDPTVGEQLSALIKMK